LDVIILCGGKGLRMRPITSNIPKPLAIVRGHPIIWHIMKHYSSYGYNDFILPLGYKGKEIKEHFSNRNIYDDLVGNEKYTFASKIKVKKKRYNDKWNITFVDTGEDTMTGARVKKIEEYVQGDRFFLTYGDGLADVNLKDLVDYHERMGKMVTVTGVDYKSNYGILTVENGIAVSFKEKPKLDHIINGGFFICNREAFSYLTENPTCVLEKTMLVELANKGELAVYKHNGYWIGIDTCKDIEEANKLLQEKKIMPDDTAI